MKLRLILSILSLLAFLSAAAGGFFYYTSLRSAFFDAAQQEAVAHVNSTNMLISQHVSDYTRLAGALSYFLEIRMALTGPDSETLGRANGILDRFQQGGQMDVCYLMDQRGRTIASSNRFEADSFVGEDYSFRPYFQEAMSGRSATYLALGVTSAKRGIYFSHPVYDRDPLIPIGVVVIKGSAEDLVKRLLQKGRPAHEAHQGMLFIVDPNGVIFVSDPKEFVLKTLWQTSPMEQLKIAETRQFGKGPWAWSGFQRLGSDQAADPSGTRYTIIEEPISDFSGWRIVHFSNMAAVSSIIANPLLKTIGSVIIGLCILIGATILLLNNLAHAEIVRRKGVEASLKESEERYRILVEESFDGIFIQKGPRIIFANRRLHQMLGYEPGELVGMEHWRIYHPDSQEMTRSRAMARLRGEEVTSHYEVKLGRKDGSWLYGEISARAMNLSGEAGIQVWIRDIHERKQAEQALRESELKYRTILESIEDGYYEVDLAGNITFFNDSLCRIFGYAREELRGVNYRRLTTEANAGEVYRVFNRIFLTGTSDRGFDWEIIRPDGTTRHIEASVSRRVDEDGKPIGFRGIVRDISEKRRLEAQLQRAQKMEAIGTLAGGVAHDLNNILSGLVSYPELLLMQIPQDSPLRKPLLTIQRSGERAAAVVQDLLTLARRGVAVSEVVNLNDIIRQYLKSPEHERLLSFHPGVTAKTHLETELLNISGSPVHLSKTVMNLVSNAAEAVREGDEIVISTANRYIDRPIKGYEDISEGDYVVLTVADPGVGISSEDIKKIFEPFYTKKKMGRSGTGLGMSVVWGTVKDHHGYIDVESREGEGTTFTLYFPATRKEKQADQPRLSVESYKGRGESILIVDDVEQQREIATEMLKGLGYSVAAVSSGEEAVEYLKSHSVDLVVLDMIMDPGMDGLDTYREILRFRPGQRAIIASGFSETERVREAQRLGVGAYVRKPFLSDRIGPAIRAELEK